MKRNKILYGDLLKMKKGDEFYDSEEGGTPYEIAGVTGIRAYTYSQIDGRMIEIRNHLKLELYV